jgi:transcriptional regulator with XRE-family HTH domain
MQQTIAERIRALREARGWSKLELGRRLGGKNPRVTVHRWETGMVIPSPQNVAKVAEVFGVPVSDVDPTGSAYSLTGPRRKSHDVDNVVEVDKIPDSQLPTTSTTEGRMRDQLDRLKGALLQIPAEHRERFTRQVSIAAARLLLELEEPGTMPGKRKRASGEG